MGKRKHIGHVVDVFGFEGMNSEQLVPRLQTTEANLFL